MFPDTQEWTGLKIIVTGSRGGLGTALGELLGGLGAQVIGIDIEGSGAHIEADLSVEIQAKRAVEDAAATLSGIDRLIGAAGVVDTIHRAERFSAEAFRGDIEGNLMSQFFVAQAAYPYLKGNAGAAIAMVSSVAGLDGGLGQAAYATAKAGIIGLIRTLAAEWAADGIRVNGVAPHLFATPKVEALPAETTERLLSTMPMKRVGELREVAEPIAFLLSRSASYITGQILRLDGGSGLATEGLYRGRSRTE
ncbi:MAG: SDR family NAD(P)-dependent oxidoreductase [Cumulibacter sp.]